MTNAEVLKKSPAKTGNSADDLLTEVGHSAAQLSFIGRISVPVLWLLRRVFFTDFSFYRVGKAVRIKVTAPAPKRTVKLPPTEVIRSFRVDEVSLMRTELQVRFDARPGSRHVLRHLVALEAALNEHGIGFLNNVPSEVLVKGAAQLETLVDDWSGLGISLFRAKLVAAMAKPVDVAASDIAVLDDFLKLTQSYAGLLEPDVVRATKKKFQPTLPPIKT